MTDTTRLLYLVNHCPGFLPTRDEWEEVQRLVREITKTPTTVNNFDVLKEMSLRGMPTIKMFPGDNIQDVRIGSKGWGSVKMAVDNASAQQILNNSMFSFSNNPGPLVMLLVVDKQDFERVKQEMESKNTEQESKP